MFKKIIVSLLIIIPVFFVVTFVSGKWVILSGNIDNTGVLSQRIYLNSADLNELIVYYDSSNDLSGFYLASNCNTQSDYISNFENRYYFRIKYLDRECRNGNIFLRSDSFVLESSMINLSFFSDADFFSIITDYSDEKIEKIYKKLTEKINKYKIFSNYEEREGIEYFSFMRKNRIYKESLYKMEILLSIIEGRDQKYLVPIEGYEIPTKLTKIPNAKRPYREKYTDGIHHSWDIDTPLGENVIALDDALVVRIVDNWDWSDFLKLRYSENMSYEDELRNLDIYRGNQIWLKTRKGDVVFYNHLEEVYSHIEEGDIIKAGTLLGSVGISGVPDKQYKDYHLDFSIQKNPYNADMAGNYDIVDYMSWDWEFKGKSSEYILENQSEIFRAQ